MYNAIFREWDFMIMEEYLRKRERSPIKYFFGNSILKHSYDRSIRMFLPHANFIIVYLEDFRKNKNGSYQLLLDFFTISDYARFMTEFDLENIQELEGDFGVPRSTFFVINNYYSNDAPIKGAHYYMDFELLQQFNPTIERCSEEPFPLLYTLTLRANEEEGSQSNLTLLYLTQPLVYPQWVFSSLRSIHNPTEIPPYKNTELVVWDVKQGNYNEIKVDGQPYVIYDAGTVVMNTSAPFLPLRQKLISELCLSNVPLFVLSHWHTDHYSLLFSLSNNDLGRIQYYVLPSNAKSLSIFCFVCRLQSIGACLNMVALPYGNPWVKHTINRSLTLYANKNYQSNINNSGLTLFVQGPHNNAMLPGDCRYKLAESQANDCIALPMANGEKHFLVMPHHGGKAGTVSYKVSNAKEIEGIVSVGANNTHGHPNATVMKQIAQFLQPNIEMTSDFGGRDIVKVL